MTTQLPKKMPELYEQDYILWLEETAKKIRDKDIENLDWKHLLEEIEDLGKAQKNAVESYLRQLFKHLLLYQYWTQERDYCGKGWLDEIDNFRNELEILLRSKTLYNYTTSIFESTYQKAKRSAFNKTKLNIFPTQCPYTLEQVLDFEYIPQ